MTQDFGLEPDSSILPLIFLGQSKEDRLSHYELK